ncbi:MAG: FKBP-type peptidyl-prolyl cis-trans isomerase, partial [Duodenibacillus sp.]|nr:FKBP-type peptidyl-prolyl cis-trans isomerase [Duodenibacillus sp.]
MYNLKKIALAASAALMGASLGLAQAADMTDVQKESYSMGATTANFLSSQVARQKEFGADVDVEMLVKGFEDAFSGKSVLKDEEIVKALNARQSRLEKLEQVQKEKTIANNRQACKEFLDKNKAKEGVKVTESGLQYEVLAQGDGKKPGKEDVVTVDYVGSFIDGTVFESTYKSQKPARFVLLSVIPGLQEGITLMNEGSRYRFAIPASLAYGVDGAG